jgi:hypothetical protein
MPTQQLALRQRHQQLPGGGAAIAFLDRSDVPVEHVDDAEPVDQHGQRGHPCRPGQRHVRLAEPDTRPTPPATA